EGTGEDGDIPIDPITMAQIALWGEGIFDAFITGTFYAEGALDKAAQFLAVIPVVGQIYGAVVAGIEIVDSVSKGLVITSILLPLLTALLYGPSSPFAAGAVLIASIIAAANFDYVQEQRHQLVTEINANTKGLDGRAYDLSGLRKVAVEEGIERIGRSKVPTIGYMRSQLKLGVERTVAQYFASAAAMRDRLEEPTQLALDVLDVQAKTTVKLALMDENLDGLNDLKNKNSALIKKLVSHDYSPEKVLADDQNLRDELASASESLIAVLNQMPGSDSMTNNNGFMQNLHTYYKNKRQALNIFQRNLLDEKLASLTADYSVSDEDLDRLIDENVIAYVENNFINSEVCDKSADDYEDCQSNRRKGFDEQAHSLLSSVNDKIYNNAQKRFYSYIHADDNGRITKENQICAAADPAGETAAYFFISILSAGISNAILSGNHLLDPKICTEIGTFKYNLSKDTMASHFYWMGFTSNDFDWKAHARAYAKKLIAGVDTGVVDKDYTGTDLINLSAGTPGNLSAEAFQDLSYGSQYLGALAMTAFNDHFYQNDIEKIQASQLEVMSDRTQGMPGLYYQPSVQNNHKVCRYGGLYDFALGKCLLYEAEPLAPGVLLPGVSYSTRGPNKDRQYAILGYNAENDSCSYGGEKALGENGFCMAVAFDFHSDDTKAFTTNPETIPLVAGVDYRVYWGEGSIGSSIVIYTDPTEGHCPFGGVYEADSYMGQKVCKVAQFSRGASNVQIFNTLDKMYVQYDSSVEGQCSQGGRVQSRNLNKCIVPFMAFESIGHAFGGPGIDYEVQVNGDNRPVLSYAPARIDGYDLLNEVEREQICDEHWECTDRVPDSQRQTNHCRAGGEFDSASGRCVVYTGEDLSEGDFLYAHVDYSVVINPSSEAGVYYNPVNDGCLYGGEMNDNRCRLTHFDLAVFASDSTVAQDVNAERCAALKPVIPADVWNDSFVQNNLVTAGMCQDLFNFAYPSIHYFQEDARTGLLAEFDSDENRRTELVGDYVSISKAYGYVQGRSQAIKAAKVNSAKPSDNAPDLQDYEQYNIDHAQRQPGDMSYLNSSVPFFNYALEEALEAPVYHNFIDYGDFDSIQGISTLSDMGIQALSNSGKNLTKFTQLPDNMQSTVDFINNNHLAEYPGAAEKFIFNTVPSNEALQAAVQALPEAASGDSGQHMDAVLDPFSDLSGTGLNVVKVALSEHFEGLATVQGVLNFYYDNMPAVGSGSQKIQVGVNQEGTAIHDCQFDGWFKQKYGDNYCVLLESLLQYFVQSSLDHVTDQNITEWAGWYCDHHDNSCSSQELAQDFIQFKKTGTHEDQQIPATDNQQTGGQVLNPVKHTYVCENSSAQAVDFQAVYQMDFCSMLTKVMTFAGETNPAYLESQLMDSWGGQYCMQEYYGDVPCDGAQLGKDFYNEWFRRKVAGEFF
ncbi:MAG: hypothetical protein ACR2PT_18150, partial [Endozoicomonas sp.]